MCHLSISHLALADLVLELLTHRELLLGQRRRLRLLLLLLRLRLRLRLLLPLAVVVARGGLLPPLELDRVRRALAHRLLIANLPQRHQRNNGVCVCAVHIICVRARVRVCVCACGCGCMCESV